MSAERFKQIILSILGTEIKFDGHVEKIIDNIPEEKQQNIINWIKACQEGINRPEPCKNYPQLLPLFTNQMITRLEAFLPKKRIHIL